MIWYLFIILLFNTIHDCFLQADNKEPSAEGKPPQHKGPPPVRPIHTPSKTPEKVISQSPNRPAASQPQVVPVSPTTKQTHVPAHKQPPAPVPEAKITKADAPAVASAPAAKPASSGASNAPSTVPQPTTTAPSAPSTESKPAAASGTRYVTRQHSKFFHLYCHRKSFYYQSLLK